MRPERVAATAVVHERPRLQQGLAARLVGDPLRLVEPPCLGALVVRAPLAHGHARHARRLGPGLVGVAVVDDPVDAEGVHVVACRLERERILPPATVLRKRRERLGADDLVTRRAVGALRHETHPLVVDRLVGTDPELRHRDVLRPAVELGRGGEGSVRLQAQLQAARVALARQFVGEVLREKVCDYGAEIREEPFAFGNAVEHGAREDGQPSRQVVAAAAGELLREALRPVLRTRLPAVHQHVVEAVRHVPGEGGPEVVADPREVGVEVYVHAGLRELVALEAHAVRGGGMALLAVGRVADAHHAPRAGRDLPVKVSGGGIERRGEVAHIGAPHGLVGRGHGRTRGGTRADEARLVGDVREARPARETHIAERVAACGRLMEGERETPAARRRFGELERTQVHVVLPLLACEQLVPRKRPPRAVRRRARERRVDAFLPAVRRKEPAFPQRRPVGARKREVVDDLACAVRADRAGHASRFHCGALGGRYRPGEHGDVLVEPVRIRRGRQRVRERFRTFHVGQRVADRLHRVRGGDPWSTRRRIAAAVREAHAHLPLGRLLDGELDRVEPVRRVERERPRRNRAAGVEDRHAAQTHRRHRVEVRHDARARDVAVHPVPPHLGPGRIGRRAERRHEIVSRRRQHVRQNGDNCKSSQLHAFHLDKMGERTDVHLTTTFSVNAPMRQEGSPAFTGAP